jgi:accessory colonization factor AcfC
MQFPLSAPIVRRAAMFGLAAAPFLPVAATAQPTPVRAFGPGGPAPAMRAAAQAFQARHGTPVEIIAGPTPGWAGRVAAEADLIFSGAEYMMADFVQQFREAVDSATVATHYLRPSAILARPGNPHGYRGLADLLARPPAEARILVTAGAGQVAMWEDIAGRTGDVRLVRAMRERIVMTAPNTGAAQTAWRERPGDFDVWLVWNTWQIAAPDHASLIEIEEPFRIWRSMGTVLTRRGAPREEVRRFVAFLTEAEGAAIFRRLGWTG